MRAVLDAKQVAVLTPTTILAFQHWKTFRKRFAPFPVRRGDGLPLPLAEGDQDRPQGCGGGKVDVLIGTHRLLSKDVSFRDLGLLVIDEEQRFGVAAKEKLKHMRTTVDALTLSATPIPRTLQMGLAGIRDMSVIETPPKDRLAIQTSIVKFSTDVIATAIRQELARDGQVYFVHNRVESIYSLAHMVQKLVPEARVAVAHGQMPEAELEKAMLAFVEGRADVLVATTIIENGLDIPRANTMIINRADRYGLAQLYQLRGRVGRSERRASAFLMVPPDTVLSEIARKRLAAMREFSELGAGFRVAALDLELRGAGNLLGGEQSGHIEAVGLDLYVKLLEQTILELKGQAPRESPRTVLNLRVDLRIPEEYVPEVHQRMSLYKRVSQVRDATEVATLAEELRDRYGPFPPEVEGLLGYAALRLRAEALGVIQVDLGAAALHLRLAPRRPSAERLFPRRCGPGRGRLSLRRGSCGRRCPGPRRAGRSRGGPAGPRRRPRRLPPNCRIIACGRVSLKPARDSTPSTQPGRPHHVAAGARLPGPVRGRARPRPRPARAGRRNRAAQRLRTARGRGAGSRGWFEPGPRGPASPASALSRGADPGPGGAGPGPLHAGRRRREGDRIRTAAALDEVLSRVSLTDAELDAYCQAHARDFDRPERIRLRQILVPTPNEARDVVRRLKKDPKSFATLAQTRSRAPEASTGGPWARSAAESCRRSWRPRHSGSPRARRAMWCRAPWDTTC
jgi:superfamily II DNA or RNA helicase